MTAKIIADVKICSACNVSLPLDLFGKSSMYKDGRRGQCSPCRSRLHSAYIKANPKKRKPQSYANLRVQRLASKYGMTEADRQTMLAEQDGKCAICGTDAPGGRHGSLNIDHCHETGKVRGLLCFRCNVTLGNLGDGLKGLSRFVEYLGGHVSISPAAKKR